MTLTLVEHKPGSTGQQRSRTPMGQSYSRQHTRDADQMHALMHASVWCNRCWPGLPQAWRPHGLGFEMPKSLPLPSLAELRANRWATEPTPSKATEEKV